jgi:rod shape-determining protein MreD
MIVTWRIGVRLALIVLITVTLQVSFFSLVPMLGAVPNLVPVVVVSLGVLGGGVVGAVCGFATGLLLDSVLLQTLGASSLVLLTVGYLAGRYREGFEIINSLVPPLLAGGFTLLAGAGYAAVQLMLGVDTPVSLLILREILVQALLAILLALPTYPLLRRVLRPALIETAPSHRVLAPASVRRARGGVRSGRRTARARAARADGGVA